MQYNKAVLLTFAVEKVLSDIKPGRKWRVRKILEELNLELQMKTPVICTPEELMEV